MNTGNSVAMTRGKGEWEQGGGGQRGENGKRLLRAMGALCCV